MRDPLGLPGLGLILLLCPVLSCADGPASDVGALPVVDSTPERARVLSAWEVEGVVWEVLGVRVAGLPDDVRVGGAPLTTADWHPIARSVVPAAVPTAIERYAVCTDVNVRCIDPFVTRLGTALLGEPPTRSRRVAWARLFEVAADSDDGFTGGAHLVLQAMLLSQRFLTRPVDLGGDQVAAITLAAWAAPPTRVLRVAAETRPVIATAVADPRAQAIATRYAGAALPRATADLVVAVAFDLPAAAMVLVAAPEPEAVVDALCDEPEPVGTCTSCHADAGRLSADDGLAHVFSHSPAARRCLADHVARSLGLPPDPTRDALVSLDPVDAPLWPALAERLLSASL